MSPSWVLKPLAPTLYLVSQNLHISRWRVGVRCVALWGLGVHFWIGFTGHWTGQEACRNPAEFSVCLCAGVKRSHYCQRETEKRSVGCCYCYNLHYRYDQYWTYPLIADIFASICKQSTVNSHLTYKQRVKELKSSRWRVV